MEAMKLVEGLTAFSDRGAGTDAERRAAAWLADQLSSGQQETLVETFWCRPNWALAHALHAVFAIVGSLISLLSPVAGVAILAVALGSLLADWLTGLSIGRLLTREHASQSVVLAPGDGADEKPVRLIICANYEAGRVGLVYRDWLRRPVAVLRQTVRGFTPGWLGWMALAIAWLLAIAALRLVGEHAQVVGLAQLPPTAALLLGTAFLLELALAGWSPAAGDNASGVAVAAALARALEPMPPQHLDVELVLTGAGDGDQDGLRQYLRRRRRERRAANTVVLGIAPCAAGRPHWWLSDGSLVPLRYSRPLRELAQEIAAEEPHLQAGPFRGRGETSAFPARLAGIPAITLGCLDERGLAPRSHQPTDTVGAVAGAAIDNSLRFALLMVDAIDAAVGELRDEPAPTGA